MRVALIGANGQLGSDIKHVYQTGGDVVYEINHDSLDIVDSNQCFDTLEKLDPSLIINTAAMHNVDICENDPQRSFLVNAIGPKNLAQVSSRLHVPLVHFSTDYIFDGNKTSPYVEDDIAQPLNEYGRSKLAGESYICSSTSSYFIVRVSGLYGHAPCRAKNGLNFVRLMLKLAKENEEVRVVDDECLSPTYTLDVAKTLRELTSTSKYGIYHMVSDGCCSWYEFAATIFGYSKLNTKLAIAQSYEFPHKTSRPKYSCLRNNNLNNLGIRQMPHWRDALRRYLSTLNQN